MYTWFKMLNYGTYLRLGNFGVKNCITFFAMKLKHMKLLFCVVLILYKAYLHDFKKNCNFKKGNRDQKSKNYANKLKIKNYRNKMELNGSYSTKVNYKAFAIPILTTRL